MRIEAFEGALLRRFGSGRNKILCLPAFADDGTAFTPLSASVVAKHFELIVCDLPGFGASLPLPGQASLGAYADFMLRVADAMSPARPAGLAAHSLSATIAVEAALRAPKRIGAVFSMEGNLTAADAYLSGRAAAFGDAEAFKTAFKEAVWEMAEADPRIRRYYSAVRMADAASMWRIGQDAARLGEDDGFGRAYLRLSALGVANVYLWARKDTPLSRRTLSIGMGSPIVSSPPLDTGNRWTRPWKLVRSRAHSLMRRWRTERLWSGRWTTRMKDAASAAQCAFRQLGRPNGCSGAIAIHAVAIAARRPRSSSRLRTTP